MNDEKTPRLKDGYTRIANAILEEIGRHRLNGTQRAIIDQIWRYSYGFNRKEAELSLSFIATALGKTKSHIDRELNTLIERKIIRVNGTSFRGRTLEFNKHFAEWTDEPKPAPKPPQKPKAKAETEPADNKPAKNTKPVYAADSPYYLMAVYLHTKIKEMAEDIGFNHASIAKVDLQKWANDFRLLWERDGVQDKHLIKDVIDWVMEDEFWRTNILSAGKLRKQFSRLVLAMKGRKQGGKTNRQMSQNERLIREIREEMEHDQDGGQEAFPNNKQLLLELPD